MMTFVTALFFIAGNFGAAWLAAWLGSLVTLPTSRKPPPLFWVDRARLFYPARVAAGASVVLLPLSVLFCHAFNDGHHNGFALSITAIATIVAGLMVCLRVERRIFGKTLPVNIWWKGFLARILTLAPHISVILIASQIMPVTVTAWTAAVFGIALLLLGIGVSGAGIFLARACGLVRSSSPRLKRIVQAAMERTGSPAAVAEELVSPLANAYALPLWRRVIVTDKTIAELTDAELTAICAHELAHLDEPRGIIAGRVAGSILFFAPLIVLRPLLHAFGSTGLIVGVTFMLIVFLPLRRLGRKMEERADVAGLKHEGEAGIYARTLERLYELNLMPAVMPRRRMLHPHLYDRLLAAGVQPSYPRPAPPSQSRSMAAFWVTLISAAALMQGVWVLLAELEKRWGL
jgi:Zn-dependent protease with chaperone function